MKAIAWLAGLATLISALGYMIVSLNRWEWNRALFFGLIVVIAEVGLATALILRRLGPAKSAPYALDPEILAALRDSRPPRPNRLRGSSRLG